MKTQPDKILDIANRYSSVKIEIEFTQQVAAGLDKVIENLPDDGKLKVTREHVIIAAVENYLETLDKNKQPRKSRVKKDTPAAGAEEKSQTEAPTPTQPVNPDQLVHSESDSKTSNMPEPGMPEPEKEQNQGQKPDGSSHPYRSHRPQQSSSLNFDDNNVR